LVWAKVWPLWWVLGRGGSCGAGQVVSVAVCPLRGCDFFVSFASVGFESVDQRHTRWSGLQGIHDAWCVRVRAAGWAQRHSQEPFGGITFFAESGGQRRDGSSLRRLLHGGVLAERSVEQKNKK